MSGTGGITEEEIAAYKAEQAAAPPAPPAAVPDDDQEPESPADKVDWLRARGVEVDLAEERGQAAAVSDAPAKPVDPDSAYSFVRIPAMSTTAIAAIEAPLTPMKAGDKMADLLKAYFADGNKADDDLMAEQLEKMKTTNIAMNDPTGQQFDPSKLKKENLDKVLAAGSAETFPLVRPCEGNKFKVGGDALRRPFTPTSAIAMPRDHLPARPPPPRLPVELHADWACGRAGCQHLSGRGWDAEEAAAERARLRARAEVRLQPAAHVLRRCLRRPRLLRHHSLAEGASVDSASVDARRDNAPPAAAHACASAPILPLCPPVHFETPSRH